MWICEVRRAVRATLGPGLKVGKNHQVLSLTPLYPLRNWPAAHFSNRNGTGCQGKVLSSPTLEGEFFWQVSYLKLASAFPSLPFGHCTANSDPHLESEGECDSSLTVIALVKKASRMQSVLNREVWNLWIDHSVSS